MDEQCGYDLAGGRGGLLGHGTGSDTSEGQRAGEHNDNIGSWVAMTPFGASAETFSADGSFVAGYPAVEQGPMGAAYYSTGVGVWESTGPQSGHFTSVQAITDVSGISLGTLTIDGYLDVSDDGQRFVDNSSQTALTFRDASGAIVAVITPNQGDGPSTPVTGTRMAVGAPGIPEAAAAATPAP